MASTQTIDDALATIRVLHNLIENLKRCPEKKERAAVARDLLIYAGLFVTEHYQLVQQNEEPYDSMVAVLDILKQNWLAELPLGAESSLDER